jgi:hypothetical protein
LPLSFVASLQGERQTWTATTDPCAVDLTIR